MDTHDLSAQYAEFIELARARHLYYPIETKADFVSQMCQSGEPVIFRGVPYEPEFAANLAPAFFFPVTSQEDLVHKALELIMSRGLLSLESLDRLSGGSR